MALMYTADPNDLIDKAAEELKKIEEIKPPVWAGFVKTGIHKERPPVRADWWYVRAAAVLRSVYRLGPVGVSKLRTKYGGKKNRGVRPGHAYKGSGNILRKILQQLETAGLVKHGAKGVHKGRVITPKGKSLLDKLAVSLTKGKSRAEPVEEKEEVKKEPAKEEIKKKEKPVEKKEEPKKEEKLKEEPKKEEKKPEPKEETPKEESKKEEKKPEAKKEEVKKEEKVEEVKNE